MARRFSVLIAVFSLLVGVIVCDRPSSRGEDGPVEVRSTSLPLERVRLQDGRTYDGLIESEDEAWVHLIQIQRSAGRMSLVIRPFERRAIAVLTRLDEPRRNALRREIDVWRNRAAIDAARMEDVALKTEGSGDARRFNYRGRWFSLESSLDEPMTRRVIVRVEQVFTAYRQMLAPRVEAARPLKLMICGAMTEYRDQLQRLGIEIKNPACFVPAENLVVAGGELNRCAAEFAKINAQHERIQNELDQLEKQVAVRLAAMAREMQQDGVASEQIAKAIARQRQEFDKEITKRRNELQKVNRENSRKVNALTGAMFARVYHEAFHAYLENYVYPRDRFDVPLWLNEGLAQVFESGMLESETLHVDLSSRELFKRLKEAKQRGESPSLRRVLAAGPEAFLTGDSAASYYLAAWSLAHYLAFERRLIDTPALDRYVAAAEKDAPPGARFEKFVGEPLEKFETKWRAWAEGVRSGD